MSFTLENLRRDARMRLESDQILSSAWIVVPLMLIAASVGYYFAYFFIILPGIFGSISPGPPRQPSPVVLQAIQTALLLLIIFIVLLVSSAIVFTYLIYKLVHRRNRHFLRQSYLYDDLSGLAREVAAKKGVDISIPLNNMDRSSREAKFEETEKSAALWAILSFFIPFITLYVFYFLMKDFFRHERHEDMFVEDFSRALAAAGVAINLPRRTIPVPDRSFILYFILSIITGGVFSIYWVYVLLEDPNNHFRHQAMVEDTILAQAQSLTV